MLKIFFITVIVFNFICFKCLSQEKSPHYVIELAGSAFFDSPKHLYLNGNENVYGEARLGYRINKYFEINISAGYEKRSFIYYAQLNNGDLVALYMKRHYIPAGINLRLYLSEFFYEKLKLWKKKEKWDVYGQLGIITLRGHDVMDKRDQIFRNQGAYVPFFLYPYIKSYGEFYISHLAGLRYNMNKHVGLFVEAGEGALTNIQIGASLRF